MYYSQSYCAAISAVQEVAAALCFVLRDWLDKPTFGFDPHGRKQGDPSAYFRHEAFQRRFSGFSDEWRSSRGALPAAAIHNAAT